jgi:hypothetical protein
MSTSNLQLIADRLQRAVQRTLQGAKPRHLTKRFRQLLSSYGGMVTIWTTIERNGKRTARVESFRANRLAFAGYAVERARQAHLTDEARQQASLKDRNETAKRFKAGHLVAAKVLCWLALALGFLAQAGCLEDLTAENTGIGCETFPTLDGGTATICATHDLRHADGGVK